MSLVTPLNPLVLSIGDAGEPGPMPVHPATPLNIGFAKLQPALVAHTRPDMVAAWLFCAQYDVFDVAAVLRVARFEGVFIATSPAPLPKPAIILNEMRACYPEIRFELGALAEQTPVSVQAYSAMMVQAPATESMPVG